MTPYGAWIPGLVTLLSAGRCAPAKLGPNSDGGGQSMGTVHSFVPAFNVRSDEYKYRVIETSGDRM